MLVPVLSLLRSITSSDMLRCSALSDMLTHSTTSELT